MKRLLQEAFLPRSYVRDLFAKVQGLRQGSMSAKEYTEKFSLLCTRAKLNESAEPKIDRYLQGFVLPSEIKSLGNFVSTTNDVVHVEDRRLLLDSKP